jgi:hypothetical protein
MHHHGASEVHIIVPKHTQILKRVKSDGSDMFQLCPSPLRDHFYHDRVFRKSTQHNNMLDNLGELLPCVASTCITCLFNIIGKSKNILHLWCTGLIITAASPDLETFFLTIVEMTINRICFENLGLTSVKQDC